jgi:flagellar protein FliL
MADADATSTDQAAPAPTGLKAKLPLAAAVVIGLAIGAGSGAVIVGPMAAKTLGYATPAPAATAGEHAEGEGEGEHAEDDSSASGAPPAVMTLENLVLNPAGSGGSRFLLLTVSMECKDAAAVTTLQSRDAELRDVVLSSLGQKTVDELADIAGRDVIKEQLTTALNERFGAKTVVRVYFPQYVVQ